MRPDGAGYKPLYCAARWIAGRGGTEDFDPHDAERWRSAFEELLAAISSTKVGILGAKNGAPEPVPHYLFASCGVDYPHARHGDLRLMRGFELYVRSFPYVGVRNGGAEWTIRL